MDAETFERWVRDVGVEYKDMEKIWAVPYSLKLINGFLGLVITKYHLEMDRQAQDKLADPSCCEGVCKEEA